MTKLSININKIATIRNARGGNIPDIIEAARTIETQGAEGITVHPRPDERHIRYKDVRELQPVLTTEFNIEGYPSREFLDLVTDVRPTQVTLVPDTPDALTSDTGWDTVHYKSFLQEVIHELKKANIRVSIFIDPINDMILHASETDTDRVELYTESYARNFPDNPQAAIKDYIAAAETAQKTGLELNAGHDLNLDNLRYFAENIPALLEVSIGHALISDSLYLGMKQTIQMYLKQLGNTR